MSVTAPPAVSHNALPPGLRLDEFEIRSVIGEGGFGIVYHAFDHALERDVAIKEYMPSSMAARSATMHVSVLSQGHVETFSLGLRSFVNEARLLARFDHPSLVKVHRFWEGNGTAYMVMPLYRGRTLKLLRQGLSASPSEAWLRGLVEPLLGVLEALHHEDVFHRDIAPDNILVGHDGKPVLLDFGAARRVIGGQTQSLTAILKPNFAPIEQYGETAGLRQGPWTDLYALGATLHFVITGQPPQPATARALGSQVNRLASVARRGVSTEFLRAVDWMMAPRPEDRPQSVAALREVLNGLPPAAAPEPPPETSKADPWQHTQAHEPDEGALLALGALRDAIPAHDRRGEAGARRAPSSGRAWPWLAGAALLVAGGAAAWVFLPQRELPIALAATAAVAAPAALVPASAVMSSAAAVPAVEAAASPASAPELAPLAAPGIAASAPEAPAEEEARDTRHEPPATAFAPPPRPKRAAKLADAATKQARVEAVPPVESPPLTEARAADAPMASPREQCRSHVLLAWYRCVKRACQASPAFSETHECQRVRQIEADNARQRAQ